MIDRYTSAEPSPALLAAQERLEQLQNKIFAEGKAYNPASAPVLQLNLQKGVQEGTALSVVDVAKEIAALPPHLGWGSATITSMVRKAQRRRETGESQDGALPHYRPSSSPSNSLENAGAGHESSAPTQNHTSRNDPGRTVKVYPDIALGMLRQGEATTGRIWLLLRHLDQEGRGWFRIDMIKHHLTHKTSNHRVCGWRQLRKLLNRGEGVFWTRDSAHAPSRGRERTLGRGQSRIWLRSAAKVAAALEVGRLTGKPVATPVATLLQGIGDVRASLYASFHSGRAKTKSSGPEAMPVARATLERLTGVGRRSQRAYEQRAGIEAQHNFAVGERDSLAGAQQRAWQQGHALFRLKDYRGHQGRIGDDYLAWQIPNSYSGCHQQLPKGRQKRINRELADLFVKEMTGNGKIALEKRYYANGKLAAKAYNRCPQSELYWPGHKTAGGRHRVWRVMVGIE